MENSEIILSKLPNLSLRDITDIQNILTLPNMDQALQLSSPRAGDKGGLEITMNLREYSVIRENDTLDIDFRSEKYGLYIKEDPDAKVQILLYD